jgi:hypothetical protein
MMRLRSAAATMHQRDVLMAAAFDGIGSLPMATIDRFREQKQREVRCAFPGCLTGNRADLRAACTTGDLCHAAQRLPG